MPAATVTGRCLGPVQRVVVVDPKRGAIRSGSIDDAGHYSCGIPAAAREPVLILHGEGGALVQSGAFAPDADLELSPLALWEATPRVRGEGGELRFDWRPIAKGEGLPEQVRYSLLFGYRKTAGEGEASLLCREPALTIALSELKDLLKDHDPAARTLTLELRAFDPSDTQGALWIGSRREWTLP